MSALCYLALAWESIKFFPHLHYKTPLIINVLLLTIIEWLAFFARAGQTHSLHSFGLQGWFCGAMECVWMPRAAELGTETESPLRVGLKGCTDLECMARPV